MRERRVPHMLGRFLRNLCHAVLYMASVASCIGTIYYAIPGFPHIFAVGNASSVQPTHLAVCVIVFLVSIHFLPGKEEA